MGEWESRSTRENVRAVCSKQAQLLCKTQNWKRSSDARVRVVSARLAARSFGFVAAAPRLVAAPLAGQGAKTFSCAALTTSSQDQ